MKKSKRSTTTATTTTTTTTTTTPNPTRTPTTTTIATATSSSSLLLLLLHLMLTFLADRLEASEYNLPLLSLDKLAENFGQVIYDRCMKVTAVSDLRIDYLLMDPSVRLIDGHNLTSGIRNTLRHVVHQKIKFLEDLSVRSQFAFERHIFDPNLKMSYPESKNLNSSDFELVPSARFNNMLVNFTMSTVHIPNNVYEKSAEVLNGVAWSASLDEEFTKNSILDKELKWQYFCSSTGFFRMFPGTTWQKVKTNQIHPNAFDCRMQKWYIQASTSPKAVLFLFDVGDGAKKRLPFASKILKFFLDTLTDEDFFNVIFFSSGRHYIDSCSNNSLLYANDDNKNKVVKYMENLKNIVGGKSDHEAAMREAMNIFTSLNDSAHRNVTCTRAVVLLSTYVPVSLVSLVQSYNQPNLQARMFVYLFNRDKKSLGAAKELACDNKGYHAVLETESQAAEQLLNFIRVLSRSSPPMVDSTYWTNVYEDTAGLDLIISVILPVFSDENFLGVVGIDISINEFAKLFEQFQFGVDAHVFIATKKGHAVYHPELKMKSKYKYEFAFNPNSNLVDIAHLEQTASIKQIKGHMMGGDSGHIQAETTVLFDNSRRIATKHVHYFFADLPNTPFSLGVSLPSRYGRSVVDGTMELNQFDPTTLQTDQFLIAPWNYCDIDLNSNVNSTFERFFHQLKIILANPNLAEYKCNAKLLKSLLFDVEATRGSYSSWIKENWDQDVSSPKGSGIELVFIGTKGGLTRFYHMSDDPRSVEFIESQTSTIHALYYLTAVYNGEEIFTFSLPFKPGNKDSSTSRGHHHRHHHQHQQQYGSNSNNNNQAWSHHQHHQQQQQQQQSSTSDMDDLLIVGSTPIVIHEEGHEGVAAVAGLLLKFSHFRDVFLNTSTPCNASKCQKICQADEIDCYLVDYNGYVIYSENSKDIGQFLGELEGSTSILMRDLIIRQGDKADPFRRGVFRRVERTDYQAVCEVIRKSTSRSDSLIGNFSIRNLFAWIVWFVHEFVLMLMEAGEIDGWLLKSNVQSANVSLHQDNNNNNNNNNNDDNDDSNDAHSTPSDDEEATDLEAFRSLMSDLIKISSKEQVEKWKENCLRQSGYNPETTVSCLRSIKKAYEPGIRGFRPCVQSYVRYVADPTRLPQSGIVFKCDLCTKSYSINLIPRTNLMLLAIDSLCHCSEGPMAEDKPIEIFPHSDDERPCESLNADAEPPPWSRGRCPAVRELVVPVPKTDNHPYCGSGHLNLMSRTILLLQTCLTLLLPVLPQLQLPLPLHQLGRHRI